MASARALEAVISITNVRREQPDPKGRGSVMTCRRACLIAVALVAGCAVASAQEAPGAGRLELGGFPGGGLWLVNGDDNTEVNFNNYDFGGGATWHLNPMVAVEAEAAYGLGISQNVRYQNRELLRVLLPYTLGTSGNIVISPGGSAKRVAGYVTGGAGMLTLFARTSTGMIFGLTDNETFVTTNVGGGVKFFRGEDAPNWGYRVDYRLVIVNSKSDAVAFFAQSKRRLGHRFYIGMIYRKR